MKSRIPTILREQEKEILTEWVREQLTGSVRADLLKESELRQQSAEFLHALAEALQHGVPSDLDAAALRPIREQLERISRARGVQGFSPSETARFVFSLKRPLFTRLRASGQSGEDIAEQMWVVTELLDRLGLYTTEVHQKSREEVIHRQQRDMLELSTPVVRLWKGVLALPIIGTLDSARTQVVMETLLQRIVETGAEIAIIDITGVPTVDTLTAQHLLKTVTAARLMGADCIISGIRPQIAQTIVHLGVELADITTKATLEDAFRLALTRVGGRIVSANGSGNGTAAADATRTTVRRSAETT